MFIRDKYVAPWKRQQKLRNKIDLEEKQDERVFEFLPLEFIII